MDENKSDEQKTYMIPNSSRILRIRIIVVFVLTRRCVVCGPAIEWSTIVLAMDMDR
jgi:hypothetical protein